MSPSMEDILRAREEIDGRPVPRGLGVTFTCACGWQEPYGFVPEADCPLHDDAEFVARMNAQFGAASASATATVAEEDDE